MSVAERAILIREVHEIAGAVIFTVFVAVVFGTTAWDWWEARKRRKRRSDDWR